MRGDIIRHFRRPRVVIFVTLLVFVLSVSMTEARRHGFTVTGKVMQVKDGDTVTISPEDGGSFFVCRLYGIDAPEVSHRRFGQGGQRYGEEASRELKRLILGQTVEVTTTGQQTYRREVCIIWKDGRDINLEMVRRGDAWAYRQYLKRPYASEYIDAEREARENRRGLWQDANPTPPWEFRKRLRGR
ncbi:MAG: thermonuclease family protein [Nitrospiraceae bacterium]|nr:thermonuclease family protein [Nitrospiraceae bacterium]